MATVDASIPLQTLQPKDPLQGIGESLQLASAFQNFQGQQALREAFANGDTSTPEGQKSLIQKVGAIDPKEAMSLQQNFLKQRETETTIDKNKALTSKTRLESGIKAMDTMSDVTTSMMMTYSDLLHKGVPDAQARQIVSQAIPSIKAHLKSQKDDQGNPLFNPDVIDQMQGQFDPQKAMTLITNAKNQSSIFQQQHQNETLSEQKRHARVEEGQGQQRIGLEGARVGLEGARLGLERERVGIERERLNGDPGTIEANAQMIASGKLPAPTGAALRNPITARMMQRVYEINPKYDAKTYQTELTGEKAFTSGKQGTTIRSLNVATDHLDTLDHLGKALKNGDMRTFNKLAQAIATETGQSAPTNFDAAKKIVADEVVKAIVGSGGGVSDREEAAKAFDKVSSPEQLSGAIQTAKKLMKGQLKGIKKQYEASTGKTDFEDRFLTGDAKNLEEGGGKKSGGDFSHLWK